MIEIPPLESVFELTLKPRHSPENLIGCSDVHPEYCRYSGKPTTKTQTKKFILVWIGRYTSLGAAGKALAAYGPTPAGQWILPFMEKYSVPRGRAIIGVADASWRITRSGRAKSVNCAVFPFLNSEGHLKMMPSAYLSPIWFWLVYAPEELIIGKEE